MIRVSLSPKQATPPSPDYTIVNKNNCRPVIAWSTLPNERARCPNCKHLVLVDLCPCLLPQASNDAHTLPGTSGVSTPTDFRSTIMDGLGSLASLQKLRLHHDFDQATMDFEGLQLASSGSPARGVERLGGPTTPFNSGFTSPLHLPRREELPSGGRSDRKRASVDEDPNLHTNDASSKDNWYGRGLEAYKKLYDDAPFDERIYDGDGSAANPYYALDFSVLEMAFDKRWCYTRDYEHYHDWDPSIFVKDLEEAYNALWENETATTEGVKSQPDYPFEDPEDPIEEPFEDFEFEGIRRAIREGRVIGRATKRARLLFSEIKPSGK